MRGRLNLVPKNEVGVGWGRFCTQNRIKNRMCKRALGPEARYFTHTSGRTMRVFFKRWAGLSQIYSHRDLIHWKLLFDNICRKPFRHNFVQGKEWWNCSHTTSTTKTTTKTTTTTNIAWTTLNSSFCAVTADSQSR